MKESFLSRLDVVRMPVISVLGSLRQDGLCEFKARLSYIVSSGPAWAIDSEILSQFKKCRILGVAPRQWDLKSWPPEPGSLGRLGLLPFSSSVTWKVFGVAVHRYFLWPVALKASYKSLGFLEDLSLFHAHIVSYSYGVEATLIHVLQPNLNFSSALIKVVIKTLVSQDLKVIS